MIVNIESYFNGSEYVCPAKEAKLNESDIIKSANNKKITSNEELQQIVTSCSGNKIELTVERNGENFNTSITPQKNTVGIYLIGAWVRDSCAGIGTITYYDENNNYFAALGHGICDSDTSAIIPAAEGEIVSAEISGLTKSVVGKAGSLNGYFTEKTIGTLVKNSSMGIFCKISDNNLFGQRTELGTYDDIKIGDAQIVTTIDNNGPEYYDIKIIRICNNSSESNENFVIKITDDRLLNSCGGIVQGMSGSPIIQDNKLVGAITHVFLNKPEEGYGVAIENMVSNYNY